MKKNLIILVLALSSILFFVYGLFQRSIAETRQEQLIEQETRLEKLTAELEMQKQLAEEARTMADHARMATQVQLAIAEQELQRLASKKR
jgi:hypothetical protein